jgi:uroporphyrinogen-III decarboxylase
VAAINWADRGDGNPSLAEARARTDKALMGVIDQARLHKMSADDVASQAKDAMSSVASGLLVTAGCAIPPDTPKANREALARAVRS